MYFMYFVYKCIFVFYAEGDRSGDGRGGPPTSYNYTLCAVKAVSGSTYKLTMKWCCFYHYHCSSSSFYDHYYITIMIIMIIIIIIIIIIIVIIIAEMAERDRI